MSDHDQLPEQHRVYVLARANVLSSAERSTAALDALVARGVTDAEELPLRERRYLAARGGMLRSGQDLDDEAQARIGHGPDLPERQADRADEHDLVVGGVAYSATEWEPDAEGGVRWIGGGGEQDCSWEEEVEESLTAEAAAEPPPQTPKGRAASGPGQAAQEVDRLSQRDRAAAPGSAGGENEVPRAVRLAGMFGGPMFGPPAPGGTTAHGPQHRQPRRNDEVGGGGTAGHRRGHEPTREQGQEFGR